MKCVILALLLVAFACVHAAPASTAPAGNLYEALKANKDTSVLVSLLDKVPALVKALQGTAKFTVFAPSNEAINNLPADVKKSLDDPKVLAEVLSYHVANNVILSSSLANELTFPSIAPATDANLRVNLYNGKAYINGKQVIEADQEASNGVFHVLSGVLLPVQKRSISAAIEANTNLSKLFSLLAQYGLNDTLINQQQVTVFAPTNAAFGQLKKYSVELTEADLKEILLYHVVAGTFYSSAFTTTSASVATLDSKRDTVSVVVDGSSVKVNRVATVTSADNASSNGVYHVIDKVLTPPASSSSSVPSGSSSSPSGSTSTVPASSTSGSTAPSTAAASTAAASTAAASTQPGSSHVASSEAANAASVSTVSFATFATACVVAAFTF